MISQRNNRLYIFLLIHVYFFLPHLLLNNGLKFEINVLTPYIYCTQQNLAINYIKSTYFTILQEHAYILNPEYVYMPPGHLPNPTLTSLINLYTEIRFCVLESGSNLNQKKI